MLFFDFFFFFFFLGSAAGVDAWMKKASQPGKGWTSNSVQLVLITWARWKCPNESKLLVLATVK